MFAAWPQYPKADGSEEIFQRVAVLVAGAIIVGVLFWMSRDAIRPFVLGLLLVYLLDPPVRWLVRRGVRR